VAASSRCAYVGFRVRKVVRSNDSVTIKVQAWADMQSWDMKVLPKTFPSTPQHSRLEGVGLEVCVHASRRHNIFGAPEER